MDSNRILALAIALTIIETGLLALVFQTIPDLWRSRRLMGIVGVALCLIVLNYWILSGYWTGWFTKTENATTVQVIAAAAQAIFAVVLVGLTFRTVRSNAEMARASEQMAEVAVQQQQAAIRPVLVFRIHPREGQRAPDAHIFVIEVFNAGAGPALDTRVFYTGPFRFAEPTDYVQPLPIARDEGPGFNFKLDQESPILDPADALRWPRTEEDAALIQEDEALEAAKVWQKKGSTESARLGDVREEIRTRSNRYYADLTARIVEQHDIGKIRAEYRDLSGAVHVSTADLLVINPKSRLAVEQKAAKLAELTGMDVWSFGPYWPDLMLGPLSVASPHVVPGVDEGATEAAPM